MLLLLIIALGVSFVSMSLPGTEFFPRADEGYYLKYATVIAEKGLSGLSGLYFEYVSTPQSWVFPNPLRVGFIIISGLWLKAFGIGFLGLACLSIFSYAIFLVISFYFSRKYFGEIFALLLSVLLAFSPLAMAISRRALMDSTANLFSLFSIWLFFDYMHRRSNLKLAFFAVIYALAILIKESTVLLSVIFIAWVLCVKLVYKKDIRLRDFLLASIVPFSVVGLVYASLGVLPYLPRLAQIVINSPSTNPYAIQFGCGPWFRYIIDYMLISPLIMMFALGAVFYCLLSRSRDFNPAMAYFLLVFVLLLLVFDFFTKNVRYVMFLDYPIRILALLMLTKLCARYSSAKGAAFLAILVMVFATFDCLNFYALFIKEGIYDPVSLWLLKAHQLIP